MSTVQSKPAETPKVLPAPLPYVASPQVVIPAVKAPAEKHPKMVLAHAQSSQTPAPAAVGPTADNVTAKIFHRLEDFAAFQQAQDESKLRQQLETPYKKWLQEDVVWIISDQERKAFRQLQTDEERQRFIQQFWSRRDPSPGTPQNEYLEEHYRRMAYADDHFSAKGMPGWKTDRGRIYIMFGPPDEIDSHSTGGRRPEGPAGIVSTFPFEKWTYRFIEGIGNNVSLEFVDTTGTGEYNMIDPAERDRLPNVPGAGLDPALGLRRQQ